MSPLWNSLVVGGVYDGEVFLGTTDMIGTAYEADFTATGFGLHLAMPILRVGWKENMSESEARALITKCMTTLLYRDCRTLNNIVFSTVTAEGPKVEEPVKLDTKWDFQSFVAPKGGAETGGSW